MDLSIQKRKQMWRHENLKIFRAVFTSVLQVGKRLSKKFFYSLLQKVIKTFEYHLTSALHLKKMEISISKFLSK